MYKYIVAFALLTPLVGIWLVEGGEYAGSVGVEGSPNGAALVFALYVVVVVVVALMITGIRRQRLSTTRHVAGAGARAA